MNSGTEYHWLLCPVCNGKTRVKISIHTELKNFPLFCPKCKKESIINAQKLHISVITEPDAQTQKP